LICKSPHEVAQVKLFRREGAWQNTHRVHPTMAFIQLMQRAEAPIEKMEDRDGRILSHPILPPLKKPSIEFTFNGKPVSARDGEVISSALIAAGISIFGHHHRDGGAQGIFCVNGQCSQCMVIADNKPVKSCMTPVKPGMKVESCEGLPTLADVKSGETPRKVEELTVQVLIIGGGPSGICAAIELGRLGVDVLIVDDKQELGGKLSLQTHNFFGSVADCYAGFRGIDIGHFLQDQIAQLNTVKILTNSTVVGVFSDGKFGIAGNGRYRLITPERVLIAAGAREKSLSFPGCDLPGTYGAGAFQTLVNRDLVHSANKLFIIGGGNVGLIGAYHALQAGIDVVGLVEALPRCGGYKVHEDKIKRLGVPVKTSHTVLRIEGKEHVEKVVVAQVDSSFKPILGTEESFDVDTVLIAVGLSPVDELYTKSVQYGIKTYAAGDTKEIAEASAAIFSGKITGRKIAREMGIDVPTPCNWEQLGETLKHKPGDAVLFEPNSLNAGVFPLIRCVQEIPCDPCTRVCPKNLIIKKESILSLPEFSGECIGCGRCVLACPGLAISLVFNDYDPAGGKALIMLPFEFNTDDPRLTEMVNTTDIDGNPIGKGKIIAIRERKSQNKRKLLLLEVPENEKLLVAGFRIREPKQGKPLTELGKSDDPIVCRCERIRKSEIVKNIRAGIRDMNQLKSVTRASLGGCSGKTCKELILRIFREEMIPMSEITMPTIRPLIAEVHLGDFTGNTEKGDS
jgi:NADPH-dependent 2,4-dienoyl-CoA reductase/sulfur reductase-like enzyme/Fe-S-cluster-containing hydrogenase component 2/bacterioferritin-associated ferredoxin